MINKKHTDAITRLDPTALYCVVDGIIKWQSGEISDAAIAENIEWFNNRASAYPSLTDQADMAYWDRQNGTTTLDDAISAVKTTYPKPGV